MLEAKQTESLGSVCILGAGKTGLVVARYLCTHFDRVSKLTLYTGNPKSSVSPDLALLTQQGLTIIESDHLTEDYDICIASPGIPPYSPLYSSACKHCREVIGEPEFAWRCRPQKWVAITGTNGKTTTTTLIEHMIRADHKQACAVGNIGRACLGEVDHHLADTWFVAELSSFQLAETKLLHPHAAILLNITPDHIEWHGSMQAYAAAKERIFANLTTDDLAIISRDDPYCKAIYSRLVERGLSPVCVDTSQDPKTLQAAYCSDSMLYVRLNGTTTPLIKASEAALKGMHNIQNMLAAAALALFIGVSVDAIRQVLQTFTTLEHRLEYVATIHGVSFVNDSKATNTDSVEKALTAFPSGSTIVLLGGHDKQTDLSSLVHQVVRKCRGAICFGEAGQRIYRELVSVQNAQASDGEGACDKCYNAVASAPLSFVKCVPHLRDAFDCAVTHAKPHTTVLLSPACSSFDEFHNMEERGTYFKKLVHELRATSDDEKLS